MLFTNGLYGDKCLPVTVVPCGGYEGPHFFLSERKLVFKDFCFQNSNTDTNIIYYQGNQIYISLTLSN